MNKYRISLSLFAFFSGLVFLFALSAGNSRSEEATDEFSVLFVEIDGAISPAQVDLLEQALEACGDDGHAMLLVRLDTPGGLVDSMRTMVMQILNAPVPVGIWVGPGGARAASAGVFLVAASNVCGMAPQSTIGAASPVGSGGEEIPETMAKKVKNDLMSLVRSVAADRGRNVEWYELAVDESVSITATEATMKKVVEFIASDRKDFMVQASARGVQFNKSKVEFDPDSVVFTDYEPGFRYDFLSWLLDPQVAYFLLLGGMAGLFFELTTPGAIFPGVFGGMCLLLGLYAMSVLPTNAAGLLLMLFGLVLFGLEIKIVSYGMLGVAGTACLFIGSVILFKDSSGVGALPIRSIIVTVAGVSMILASGVYLVARSARKKSKEDLNGFIGQSATVLEWDNGRGKVFISGERWNAKSLDDHHIYNEGDQVVIVGVDKMTLTIESRET